MLVGGIIVAFVILIMCVLNSIPLAYGLLVCWLVFMLIAKKEHSLKEIFELSWQGGKTALIVIKTLILIGATIGIWMSAGTISSIVYYSFSIANPQTFILVVFIVCALVSLVIGTSFGTVGVIGLPLMIVARSGDINLNLVAGAIISGIYFGDRCSPLSSSASLVAAITNTNLFENIKRMFKTSWIALLATIIIYLGLSILYPLQSINRAVVNQVQQGMTIGVVMLIPVGFIIVLALFKRPISESILYSIVASFAIGMLMQHRTVFELIESIFMGYKRNDAHALISGGGVISMVNPISVVLISCMIAGILNGLDSFKKMQNALQRDDLSRSKRFIITIVVSLVTAGIGCNQSVSIIMTNTLVKGNYHDENSHLAMDIENSSVLLSPMIPWNIAVFVPTSILGVSFAGYLPFACYLYLVPMIYLGMQKMKSVSA